MRQQYHFKKVGEDVYIWDVNKLLAEHPDIPVVKVPLDSIAELHEPYWYSAEGDSPTCASVAKHSVLIEQANLNFPILLHSDGSVMDGMHRVCKAYNQGLEEIESVRLPITPPPDYINVSADELPY